MSPHNTKTIACNNELVFSGRALHCTADGQFSLGTDTHASSFTSTTKLTSLPCWADPQSTAQAESGKGCPTSSPEERAERAAETTPHIVQVSEPSQSYHGYSLTWQYARKYFPNICFILRLMNSSWCGSSWSRPQMNCNRDIHACTVCISLYVYMYDMYVCAGCLCVFACVYA